MVAKEIVAGTCVGGTAFSAIALSFTCSIGMTSIPTPPPSVQNPPDPAVDAPAAVEGCGVWDTDPDLIAHPLEVTEGDWLDSERLHGTTDWRCVASQFPCQTALCTQGRLRYFREGSLEPIPTSNPGAVSAWQKKAWHARALVQAGPGENRDAVANQNDFWVNSSTGFGAASRVWERFSNYQPPAPGIEPTKGQVIRFKVRLTAKSRIVLDRRGPSCAAVESACAAAEVDARAAVEIDGAWRNGAMGEEFQRVFSDPGRRGVKAHVTTSRFCTEGEVSTTESSGGSITLLYPRRVGAEWRYDFSRTWTAPLSNLYDSGFLQAPLVIDVEICKVTPSSEPIQSWIRVRSDGRIHASINAGTWAEGLAEVSCDKLDIAVNSGCTDCGEHWNEPSPLPSW